MKRTGVVGMLAALAAVASAQEDKAELRFRFKPGEEVQFKILYAMKLKLDEIPEAYQGLLPDTPVDIKFEGVLDAKAKEVNPEGKATLEGKWRSMKVKGTMLFQEIDFVHPSKDEKKEASKPQDPDLPAFGDLEASIQNMAENPVRLEANALGRVTVRETGGKHLKEISGQFLALNGLMGALPQQKVGKGESWQTKEQLDIPGVGETMMLIVSGESRYEGNETVDDRACAVIKSMYTVSGGGQTEGKPDRPLDVKFKAEGQGEGTTVLFLREGRLARSASALHIKVSVEVPNPGGGEDVALRGDLKVDHGVEAARP